MKNLFKLSLVLAGLLAFASDAFSWGQKGHDVTCEIAERHLSKKTKRQIDRIFDGKSLVYWACWLDNASYTPQFAYTKTWHYRDTDPDENFDDNELCVTGDVVTAIDEQIKVLKSGNLDKEEEATALKILVHLVGDMHCPMHMGRKSDLGGNRHQVRFFESGKNLHSVWDSSLPEAAHKWTYSEWADQIDRGLDRKAIRQITAGTTLDWGRQTYEITCDIYESTPVGSKISYDYIARWTPVIEQQMLYGGLRLAAILNDIFDPHKR